MTRSRLGLRALRRGLSSARLIVPAIAICAPAAALHAQTTAFTDTTFTVARNAVIDITVRTGRVVVRGADRSTAELRTNGTNYQLRSSGVSVTLAVAGNSSMSSRSLRESSRRNDDPEIELIVPRAARLVIHGRTSDVRVTDVSGDVEVHNLTGDIDLAALGGRAIVETLSGDVTMSDIGGDVRLSTVSGDVIARGLRGAITVNTTSGDITLGAERVTEVKVDGMTSDVLFEGSFAPDARMQITTHSGDVTLRLPESAGGILEASSFNGDISGGTMTLLPSGSASASSERGRSNRSIGRFEFGGGGSARVVISTFNGDITLQRGPRRGSE